MKFHTGYLLRFLSPLLLVISGHALALGPDLLGWKLDMTPAQIKERALRQNKHLKWDKPTPQHLTELQGGNLIYYSHYLMDPTTYRYSEVSFDSDLDDQVIAIKITQTTRSSLPLAEVVGSALAKYGKPFTRTHDKFDFHERFFVAWGGDTNGRPINDPKIGEEKCSGPANHQSGAGCGWTLSVMATRKPNTDIVEILSILSSPTLRQAAYVRAKQGKAKF